jgi:hypothetical protein
LPSRSQISTEPSVVSTATPIGSWAGGQRRRIAGRRQMIDPVAPLV